MEKINFESLPSTKTPLNPNNINKMQENIENAINASVVTKIGGANYLLNSQRSVQIIVPDSNYNQYWWTNIHPMCSKTSSKECEYTLSFRFVPTDEGNVPASSIVVGGMNSGDAWGKRIYFDGNWKIEKHEGYYIYSVSFVIAGNNDEYMSRIGFLAESGSSNVGGTVSNIKLEEGMIRSDWTPCAFENVFLTAEERIIGVWEDGRFVYRKVIQLNSLQNGERYATGISNMDDLIFSHCSLKAVDGIKRTLPWIFSTTNNEYGAASWAGGYNITPENEIWIQAGSDLTNVTKAIFILEYTKTTD